MSDEIIDNISYTKKGEETDNNNQINNVQQLGYSHDKKLSEEDNKNNINNIKNPNNTNNDLTNKSIIKNNRALLDSAIELDLINNTQVQNAKNNKINKKTPNKTNNSYLHLSNSSRDNLISTTNMMVQTTTAQSGNIQNLKKKYLDFQKKNSKLKKNKSLPNLKKSFSQTKFESFLERVKEKQKLKELHINNIRCKSIENETSEMNVHPKINKTSINLLKNMNRKPLYQEKPLNEEKNLEKDFQNFYAKTLKDNQANPYIINTTNKKKKDIKDINDKYNKFYEDKIKWKNNVEQKNKNRKLIVDQEYDEYIEKFPFKPSLNKKSIYIANNKLYRNRSIESFSNNNNFFETGNESETLNKFKTKLKYIINNFYIYNNNHQPILNRKNGKFKRTVSEIDFNKKININNVNNKYIKKKQKPKINYKLNEKKYVSKQNNNIFEKKEIHNNNLNEKDYLLEQKEGFKNKSQNKQKESEYDKEDLYKLNVRPGAAWNNEVVNKITPLQKYDSLIEGLI